MTWLSPDPVDIGRLDWLRHDPLAGGSVWPRATAAELREWHTWGFTGSEIVAWREALVRSMQIEVREDDPEGLYASMLPMSAALWRGGGFSPTEAGKWCEATAGHTASVNVPVFAREWCALELDADLGREWLGELDVFGDLEIDLRDIGRLLNAGWSSTIACLFLLLRRMATGAQVGLPEAVAWAETGMPVELVLTYARAGMQLGDIGRAERSRRETLAQRQPWKPPMALTVSPEDGAMLNVVIAGARDLGIPAGPWTEFVWPDARITRTLRQSLDRYDQPAEWPPRGLPTNRPQPQQGVGSPWDTLESRNGWVEPPMIPEDHALPPEMGFLSEGAHVQAIHDYLAANVDNLEVDEHCEIAWPPEGYLWTPGSYWEPNDEDEDVECSEHGEIPNRDCDECEELAAESVEGATKEAREEEDSVPAVWHWLLHVTTFSSSEGSSSDADEETWEWFETAMHPLSVYYSESPVR
ncbi:hypothetical protein [Promicromonospora sp. NPDC023987]|uniref:hypothetical protein n=1 Tax=Promicromonospora sp. NPDC023987 TaxID=3155360 RepID=UPI0033C26276